MPTLQLAISVKKHARSERNLRLYQYFAVLVGMKSIKNLKQVNTPNDCDKAFATSFSISLRLLVQLQLQQYVLPESGAQPITWV